MAKSAPFSCKTAQNPQGHDHGQGFGSRKRQCGRASDIAGSCPQARPQQPPAPTASRAPAAIWTHPYSKSRHIAECVLRISMTNTLTTAIRLLGHCYQVFNQGHKKGRSHIKNGQRVAGVSSTMLQPNPSNEVLIVCRILLFPSCLRTISSSPGLLESRWAFALSVSPFSKDTAKEQSSQSSPRDVLMPQSSC